MSVPENASGRRVPVMQTVTGPTIARNGSQLPLEVSHSCLMDGKATVGRLRPTCVSSLVVCLVR